MYPRVTELIHDLNPSHRAFLSSHTPQPPPQLSKSHQEQQRSTSTPDVSPTTNPTMKFSSALAFLCILAPFTLAHPTAGTPSITSLLPSNQKLDTTLNATAMFPVLCSNRFPENRIPVATMRTLIASLRSRSTEWCVRGPKLVFNIIARSGTGKVAFGGDSEWALPCGMCADRIQDVLDQCTIGGTAGGAWHDENGPIWVGKGCILSSVEPDGTCSFCDSAREAAEARKCV
ncbi:hypothetical protein EDC01DRAFT_109053 [Geopyxis carbonaria]|nr:hypothetical protein EDC01DRAFT_109053 [Geopyxis carbonaria]